MSDKPRSSSPRSAVEGVAIFSFVILLFLTGISQLEKNGTWDNLAAAMEK